MGHPTDPTAIVLRMEEGGGFVMVEFAAAQAPIFTLYGDGTVIYRPMLPPEEDPGPFGALPAFRRATMNESQIGALVRFALGPGRLADARPEYRSDLIADAPTTVFSIDAAGFTKSVSVYALGIDSAPDPGQPASDQNDRAGFLQLSEVLRDFGAEVADGDATDAGSYEPELYRATLIESSAPLVDAQEWPWDDLTLDDFASVEQFAPRIATITAAQAKLLSPEPQGGVTGINVTSVDGDPLVVVLRPLLPDEEALADEAASES